LGSMPVGEVAPPPLPSLSIPDLEDELSRALAEPFAGPSAAETARAEKQPPESPAKTSFADGLSELLDKPRGRKRRMPFADAPAESVEPEAPPVVEPSAPDSALVESGAATEGSATVETPAADDASSASVEDRAPDVSGSQEVNLSEVAASGDLGEPDKIEAISLASQPAFDVDDLRTVATAAPTSTGMKVLGTYNAGGRTYSMYSDGSVEAMTETGVERFESMDALRRHLTAHSRAS
jgi:hypothetical protein